MTDLTFLHAGFGSNAVDYETGWQLQRALHAQRVSGDIDDVAVMLEHQAVYTAGKRTEPQDLPFDGTPVVEVDRGGKITWHGPGQLVGYPIVQLPEHVYVVDYVRRLEEALIRVCAQLGLATGRIAGRSGVWLAADGVKPERKVAALGVRVAHNVTMHGLALNCDNAMDGFDGIVPCGIADAGVTTLTTELGRHLTVTDVLPIVEEQLRTLLDWTPYEPTPALVRPEPTPATSSGASISYGLQPLS